MSDKALKMVTCSSCETKVFIPGDLAPLATVPCSKCGHPIMMPMMLRQFELRSFVASGGNGTVYRGWDTVLERHGGGEADEEGVLEDPNALESFYREARACARLNHTNIIHIYTFDEWEGLRYLVMELADRGSLDTRIEKQVRVDELAVLDIGIKIASALDIALKHDLIHRDIKPGNILFDYDITNRSWLISAWRAKPMQIRNTVPWWTARPITSRQKKSTVSRRPFYQICTASGPRCITH
jgi:serine/threonine protein kinase